MSIVPSTINSLRNALALQQWILFSVGFLWLCWLSFNWLHWWLYPNPFPADMVGRLLVVEGTVDGLVRTNHDRKNKRFTFKIDRIETGVNTICEKKVKVRLAVYYDETVPLVKSGERWRFVVRLKQPNGQASMGSNNYEDWLFENRIQATGYVHKDYLSERLEDASWWDYDVWRTALIEHIEIVLPTGNGRALVKALVLGDRSEVSQETWSALIATGTSHLLAISGLHIGLIALFFGYIGGFIWRRSHRLCLFIPAPMMITICALLGGFLYAALAGFSIPTFRAVLMLMVVCVGFLSKRYFPTWFILFAALIVVSSAQPASILSAGFVLSFLATAIILNVLRKSKENENKFVFWIRLQVILTLIMYPAVIWYFGQISSISVLINLVFVPLIGWFVLPFVFFMVLLSFVFPQWLFSTDWVLSAMAEMLFYAEHISGGSIDWTRPFIFQIILAIVLLWIICLGNGQWWKRLSYGLVCIALLYPYAHRIENGRADIVVLDVGQGLSVLIMTRNHTMLFDTGLEGMGQRVINPAVRYFGRRNLDIIAVSHDDIDHRGGLKWLKKRYPLARVVKDEDCMGHWRWDEVTFTWLSTEGFEGNNRSCVLKVVANGEAFLLTGDIEKEAEMSLIKKYDLTAHWLLSPHHGSKTSSSMPFLQKTKARNVFVSAGFQSRYGHPHKKVIERYHQLGMNVYNTACSGSALVRLGANATMPTLEWRKHQMKFWWRQCNQTK